MNGNKMNNKWNVNVRQALYRENGTWFHVLDHFPGALFDANGYIIFRTRQEYERCASLQIGKELGVPHGIASIPGYVSMREYATMSLDLEMITSEIERRAADHPIADLQTIRAEIKGRISPNSR